MPNQERQYNEETSEILGKVPSWIVRWGLAVIFVIFMGLILGSYLMKYPQILTAPIVLTTANPPADLLTKSSGRIDTIFVNDGHTTSMDQVVAMLQNSAVFEDVIKVRDMVGSFEVDGDNEWVEESYSMGSLQSFFSEFKQQYLSYSYYVKAGNIEQKRVLLAQQINKYEKYIKQVKKQGESQRQDYEYTVKNLQRDSLLYQRKAISVMEYEQSLQTKILKKGALEGFEASMTSTEISLLQMNQQLLELDMQYENEITAFHNQLNESCSRLLAQIEQWQQTYLLIAPIAGKVSFSKYWSSNQNIVVGEKLATIMPADSSQVVGIMEVPSAGFGRVEIGQTVNVKLNGYPYFEYGILKGEISRISSVPDKTGYIVEVVFLNGLQSTYKEQLNLIQQMDGTGEIITRDERLILRFINPLRAFFDKVSN